MSEAPETSRSAKPERPSALTTARARAAVAFICVALGLVLARDAPPLASHWYFAVGSAASFAAIVLRGRWWRVLACVALLCVAAGWGRACLFERVETPLTYLIASAEEEPKLATLEGLVLDDPRLTPRDEEGLSRFLRDSTRSAFPLRVDALVRGDSREHATGRVWVRVDVAPGSWREGMPRAGDRVRLTGLVSPTRPPRNPGTPDRRIREAQNGFLASISLTSASLILDERSVRIKKPGPIDAAWASILRWRADARARAVGVVESTFNAAEATGNATIAKELVLALLLGEAQSSPDSIRAAFTRLGLAHALSISGFHLAVMAAVTLALVRLTGDRGWLEPAIVAGLVLAYTAILPPQSPILRSGAMVLALLGAEALRRRYDRLTLLLWIAIALLIWRPADLWSLGYQLTIGLTALLFWSGAHLQGSIFGRDLKGVVLPPKGPLRHALDHVRVLAVSTVLCVVASAPIIILRTGLFSPIALIATIIVTPLIVLVLWVGYVALLAGFAVPALAPMAGFVLAPLATWTVALVRWLDRLPGSIILPPVSTAWALAASLVLTLALRGSIKRGWRFTLVAGVCVWVAGEWGWQAWRERAIALRVDMLAVGDGSCILLRSGGDALLWDAGSLQAGIGRLEIPRALRALGTWRVPTVIITHPDIDHFGALPDLIEPLGVRRVLVGEKFLLQAAAQPEGSAASLLSILKDLGVGIEPLRAGDALALGERATMDVLSPPPGAAWEPDNEHSLVLRAVVPTPAGRRVALLTGDVQDQAIRSLRSAHPGLRAHILELPHHGSARPDAIGWVAELDPEIVLQSTGPRREGDPRWAEVRESRHWRTTATHGACFAEVLHDGRLRVGSFRE